MVEGGAVVGCKTFFCIQERAEKSFYAFEGGAWKCLPSQNILTPPTRCNFWQLPIKVVHKNFHLMYVEKVNNQSEKTEWTVGK